MVNQPLASLPVVVIGAGPAGLMAAEVLASAGFRVQVYEQKPSAARKLLMAGKTGLNISHAEDLQLFIARYDQAAWLAPLINAFDAAAIREWMRQLGVASYVGSSGRIFPVEMKAAPLLRAWINRLKHQGVEFFYRHQWQGWDAQHNLCFNAEGQTTSCAAGAVILALGGGSWARLGSNGAWYELLNQQGIALTPLQASNVGVQIRWSCFMQPHAGQPLKGVEAWVNPGQRFRGDAMLSAYGFEGGLIYQLSRPLRQQLNAGQRACFYLDLLPDIATGQLEQKLAAPTPQRSASQSLTNQWRKAGLEGLKAHLIRELVPREQWPDAGHIARLAKRLPVYIEGLQAMDDAISTAGGVAVQGLDHNLMLIHKPGVFCAGEMLDWDAPTGGYLLTACLATGRAAGQGVIRWLNRAG